MASRLRRIAVIAALALVAVALVLVISVRPDLQDDLAAVDEAWEPLREPLVERYAALAGVQQALAANGAEDRTVTKDLAGALADWQLLAVTTDSAAQARLASELEGLAARARALVRGSPRLAQNEQLAAAFAAFDETTPPLDRVEAYNTAVLRYERTRTGGVRRIVATLDGYDPRPSFELPIP